MRRKFDVWRVFLFLGLLLAGFSWAEASTRYLVVFAEGGDAAQVSSQIEQAGGTSLRMHGECGVVIATSDDPDFARDLRQAPLIQSVEEDVRRLAASSMLGAFFGDGQPIATVSLPEGATSLREVASLVTDPTTASFFPIQWNLPKMQSPEAWEAGHLGDPDVTVAIVDSGIDYTHMELVGRVDLERSVSFVTEEDALVEQLFPGTNPIVDLVYQGTFAAGMIACNAIGIACIAPNINIVAVKAVDLNLEARTGDMVSGILYSAAIGADIINLSFDFTLDRRDPEDRQTIKALRRAIKIAQRSGSVVIASSGNIRGIPPTFVNADENGSDIIVPAEVGPIVVGALGPDDQFSNVSNYGLSLLDISAPSGGVYPPVDPFTEIAIGICSSFTQSPFLTGCLGQKDRYFFSLGSFISSAQASGVAGLIASSQALGLRGDRKAIERQLLETVDDVGEVGFDAFAGRGRINAFAALTTPVDDDGDSDSDSDSD